MKGGIKNHKNVRKLLRLRSRIFRVRPVLKFSSGTWDQNIKFPTFVFVWGESLWNLFVSQTEFLLQCLVFIETKPCTHPWSSYKAVQKFIMMFVKAVLQDVGFTGKIFSSRLSAS